MITMNVLLIGAFTVAVVLIAASAWMFSRLAYWAILILLGLAIALAILRDPANQPLGVAIAIVVYGAFVYLVSVQFLMQRRVTEVATRAEFRQAMEAANRFHGSVKALYHLPVALLIVGIIVGVVGKLSE